jgi:hypothetical protein
VLGLFVHRPNDADISVHISFCKRHLRAEMPIVGGDIVVPRSLECVKYIGE